MSAMLADNLFGVDPTRTDPSATPLPLHQGSPEPSVAKSAPTSRADSPFVAVVALLAVAVLLTQVSFRGEVAVKG